MSDDKLLSRITVDPEVCHGKPSIRGLRYPVETILEYLAGGDSVEDLLKEFSDLEREDIEACSFFSKYLDKTLAQAEYDKLEDGSFSGRIASCPGVIALSSSLKECEDELRSTLEDWLLVGLKLGHKFPAG